MDLKERFINFLQFQLKVISKLSFEWPDKKRVVKELICNGVSYAIALLVSSLLHSFISVKSYRNLWGLSNKKHNMMVNKDTWEWLNYVIVFAVGLVVFTIVENFMEAYYTEKEKLEEINKLNQTN